MDNEKILNNVKSAIAFLELIRKEMEKPPTPSYKRGEITLYAGRSCIHDGRGNMRFLVTPYGGWRPSEADAMGGTPWFARRAEWNEHFLEPYPLAPKAWQAAYDGKNALIEKHKLGWTVHTVGTGENTLESLHVAKGIAAARLGVPDDVELKWEIVE